MTRKDYVLLAHALHSKKPEAYGDTVSTVAANTWYQCVHALADALRSENPRFDYDRFVTACETGTK